MAAKKTAAKKKPLHADLAKKLGVSRQTITNWKNDGVDLTDLKALRERVKAKNDRASRSSEDDKIRRRRLEAETRREEVKLAKEEGSVISRPETNDALARIGAAVKAAIARLEADLPPLLEGLSPAQMQKIVRGKCDEVLALLEDGSSKVWPA